MILATDSSSFMIIVWIVFLVAIMYFMMIRPQSKEQKRKNTMLSEMAIGDTVLTTSGFYGTIIDIQEDMVIVEFGNNRNCRIPMTTSAIADVEKPQDSVKTPAAVEQKEEKKSWKEKRAEKKADEKK